MRLNRISFFFNGDTPAVMAVKLDESRNEVRRPQASFPSRSLPPDLQVWPQQRKQLSSTYLTEQSSGLALVNDPTPASHATTFIGLPLHLHIPAGENSKPVKSS